MVVELNRRLVKGYIHFKDDPRIVHLKKSVTQYNKQLRLLGIRDHQVEYARFSFIQVVATLVYRLGKLTLLAIGTLPGLLLFTPVFITTKVISKQKSQEALAASTVKLQGRDVMATWKLLVALAFAPALYAFYTTVFTYWTYRNRINGLVPEWVPLWLVVLIGMILFPTITFAALRIGEVGMDILKSLRPLVLSLNPSSANTLAKLRKRRSELAEQVTEAINTLGPELFPDFDATRIVTDPFRNDHEAVAVNRGAMAATTTTTTTTTTTALETRKTKVVTTTSADNAGLDRRTQEPLPRNESFHDLANIGFFSTRPPSRSHSRSHSHSRSRSRSSSIGGAAGSSGYLLKPFSQFPTKEGFDEVSSKIRDAMRERGERRRRHSEDGTGSWDMASSTSSMPGTPSSSEEFRKDV